MFKDNENRFKVSKRLFVEIIHEQWSLHNGGT